ncbi:MAG: TIGR00341 family protein [Phormidesmis sp.]
MARDEPSTEQKAANTTADLDPQKPKLPAKRNLEEENEDSIHKQPFLALMRYYLPEQIHRPGIRTLRKLGNVLSVNQGAWHWLDQKPLPLKILNRSLWRTAEPSFNYYIMLFLSGVISTLGLLAGSTAAIIGAMIVAPLMGPIVGMAFAITMGNRRLLKRAGLSVVTGALLTIMTAYLICQIVGINTLNPEILERTRPTLLDLAIGLAAGAAGSFGKTRREVADALPGVAIAVALVPPLSVIGIGLAFGDSSIFFGSSLLFLTNLAGIVLSGGLIFIWQDYGSMKRARKGLTASTATVLLLGVPLGFAMKDLIVEERARTLVGRLIREETLTFSDTDIRRLRVDSAQGDLQIDLEVAAPEGSINRNQIDLVHRFLEKELARQITLKVNVLAADSFEMGPPDKINNKNQSEDEADRTDVDQSEVEPSE